ncbi:hypothetical protein H6784_01635 [Candidatus Nomurabacteria bacterium]|nr:hypothetical protein [Candidatus Nomurabacteria bacterium]
MPEAYICPATFISASDFTFTYIRDDVGYKQNVDYLSSEFKKYIAGLLPGQRIFMTWKKAEQTGISSILPERLAYVGLISSEKKKKPQDELVEA